MTSICIRVDSSATIGLGHLTRCMTLAEAFQAQNKKVSFISRNLPGNGIQLIKNKGFHVEMIKEDQNELREVCGILEKMDSPTCLIIDHYAIGKKWESAIKSSVKHLMVIDDLADREHDCDILLDQNYSPRGNKRYDGLVSTTTLCLLGPDYAILRNEFTQFRPTLPDKNRQIKNILISFGGSDFTNETEKAITACSKIKNNISLDVVVGAANQNHSMLKSLCEKIPNINYHFQTDDMAQLMTKADLAIGGAGISLWERCCLGLPAIVISIAKNQEEGAKNAAEYGAINYLGKSENVDAEQLSEAIIKILESPNSLENMRTKCKQLVDGKGCKRIMEKLRSLGI